MKNSIMKRIDDNALIRVQINVIVSFLVFFFISLPPSIILTTRVFKILERRKGLAVKV